MGQLQERYKSYRRPQKYAEQGIYPYFRAITSKQGTEVEMDGHHVLMFGSNAYTGLTGDERIIAKAKEALDKYGSGCAGSRFLNGTLDLHEQLEKELGVTAVKEFMPMQPGDVPVTFADTSALERDMGFKPSTTLREGLRRFAEWYKEFYKV